MNTGTAKGHPITWEQVSSILTWVALGIAAWFAVGCVVALIVCLCEGRNRKPWERGTAPAIIWLWPLAVLILPFAMMWDWWDERKKGRRSL